MRLKSTAVLCHSQLWPRNPSAVLLAGTRSCASSSGGSVSSKQNQRELVTSPAFLQSHHQALPLERWPALWWPLPISTAVWISGSSEQSGAAAEIRKYIYIFSFGFCHGSVFIVRCEQLGPPKRGWNQRRWHRRLWKLEGYLFFIANCFFLFSSSSRVLTLHTI